MAKVVQMRVFVPMEDGPFDSSMAMMLVPYRCGLTCEHGLREPDAEASGTQEDSIFGDASPVQVSFPQAIAAQPLR
jgi:hypothetical protein